MEGHGGPGSEEVRVIALVASAGGLEAVSRVLEALPERLEAAVVVLLHQAPDRTSRLVDILGRRSTLSVAAAEHGAALRAGQVIVAPPGKRLLAAAQLTATLIESGAFPPSRPSVDLLLTTLATAVGDRAVNVVLSGGGHDGATGATAVHSFGGTVIATDEASSGTFAMPLATIRRDHAIDHVVALDDVAALLTEPVGTAGS